jgi:hypothetical protein
MIRPFFLACLAASMILAAHYARGLDEPAATPADGKTEEPKLEPLSKRIETIKKQGWFTTRWNDKTKQCKEVAPSRPSLDRGVDKEEMVVEDAGPWKEILPAGNEVVVTHGWYVVGPPTIVPAGTKDEVLWTLKKSADEKDTVKLRERQPKPWKCKYWVSATHYEWTPGNMATLIGPGDVTAPQKQDLYFVPIEECLEIRSPGKDAKLMLRVYVGTSNYVVWARNVEKPPKKP